MFSVLVGFVISAGDASNETLWETLKQHVTSVRITGDHDDRISVNDEASPSVIIMSIEWRDRSVVEDHNDGAGVVPTLLASAVVRPLPDKGEETEKDDGRVAGSYPSPDDVVNAIDNAAKEKLPSAVSYSCELWASAPAPLPPLRPEEGYDFLKMEGIFNYSCDNTTDSGVDGVSDAVNGSRAASSPSSSAAAAAKRADVKMRQWGLLVQNNILDGMRVKEFRQIVNAAIEESEMAIHQNHPRIRMGQDDFMFKEIASRNLYRFDLRLLDSTYPEATTFVRHHVMAKPLVSSFLRATLLGDEEGDDGEENGSGGNDASQRRSSFDFLEKHINYDISVVYSRPGAIAQGWHADGDHQPQGSSDAGWHIDGWETRLARPYAVCLFLPLIDLNEEVGYPQFWPGSHRNRDLVGFGKVAELTNTTFDGICNAGDGVWYDYRLLHRGMPNKSQKGRTRPVVQIIFKKRWYVEKANYGHESIHANPTGPSQLATVKDPARVRQPPVGFHCGESIIRQSGGCILDDNVAGSVAFHCTLPPSLLETGKDRVIVRCRDRSVGALLPTIGEKAVNNDEIPDTDAVDPNFFDGGYTLAGRTGFQVWAGFRLLVESLLWPLRCSTEQNEHSNSDHPRLIEWQNRLIASKDRDRAVQPLRVVELGAGVGVLGMCLAAAGAQVLLTDLPTLVDSAILPNLAMNWTATKDNVENDLQKQRGRPPGWLSCSSSSDCGATDVFDAVPIGHGWANATALDWTRPADEQLTMEQLKAIDLIIASDCVWLSSMLDGLLDTVASIFASASAGVSSSAISFLMSFQRRDSGGAGSGEMFTTVDTVLGAIKTRGWKIDCLAWRPITLENSDETKEIFVFEVTQAPPQSDACQ